MDISHLITPYKYGRPVLTGSGVKGSYDERAVDCPTVFSHNGRFYLMHAMLLMTDKTKDLKRFASSPFRWSIGDSNP